MSDFTIPVGTLDPNLSAMGRHVHLATDLPETGTNGYVLVSNGPDTPATFQPTGTAPPNAHVLATTAGLGSQHTTSGLTSGMVLRASGAAAAAFAFLIASDLPAHTHDASEIVTGVMLRARLPSQVAYTDVSNNFAAAQTVTGVLHVRSGASGTNGVFQIGRTSDEATLAAIASAGNYSTDSQVGDLVLRNEDSTKALRFLAGSGGSALVVKSVEVDVPTGPFVVGPDPSGTAIVRAGGQARFYTNTTYPGSEWAAPVISIIDTAGTGWLSNNFLALSLNGAAGQITVGRSRGTLASPSPMLVGDVLGALWGAGQYDTTVGHFVQSAGFRVFAAENWSATTLGSYITAVMTPPGGATSSNYFRWDYNAFYPLIAGGATLGLSANRWGKMWGQDADFNTSVVVGVDPGGSALVRIGGDLKVQVAGEPSLIARGTGTSAYEGGVLQLIASGVTTAAQQATWLLHNQNNLNTAQANFQIQQRQDDGTYVGTIGTYDYPTAAWSFYNAVNIPTGTLTIGAFNANHLVLLSGNSVYGWRLDTTDGGGGNVPLRLYRRTASVDTQVLNVRNEDGSFQVQAPVATQVATTVGWNAASSYMFGTGSTGTGFRGGFSHNIYWNGTNWILPADGANSGGSMVTMGIASNMEFFVVASAGVSSQTISNATMDSTHKRMILSTVALTPRGAGSMTLGTVSLPWGAMYGNTSLDITGGGLKFNVSDSGGHSALEHGRIDGTASTPFMDWHAGATAVDYDFRFIASTGTGVTAGGTMTFDGAIFKGNGATVLGASAQRWGKFWGQDASFSLDVTMDVLGTFDHTGTRFSSGTGPVADDVMSWHSGAAKWRPRFLQTQFGAGVMKASNIGDGTAWTGAWDARTLSAAVVTPSAPTTTAVYGAVIVNAGSTPPANVAWEVKYEYSNNAGVSWNSGNSGNPIARFSSQSIVHVIFGNNGAIPSTFNSDATTQFRYYLRQVGSSTGSYSTVSNPAVTPSTAAEINAFGLIAASQISAVYLSSITANIGSITAGQLVASDGKSVLQLDSSISVPGTVTQGIFFGFGNPVGVGITGMYIDFTATGSNPLFHHTNFDILATGSVVMKGVLRDTGSKFVIDVGQTTARLLTLIDETPTTRLKLGEINTGTTDYGLEIWADNGNKIVELSGTAMFLQDSAATPLAGVNIKGTLPGTWTRYLNLNGSGAMLHHERLDLNYDGTAKFGGGVDINIQTGYITQGLSGTKYAMLLRDLTNVAHGMTDIVDTSVFGAFSIGDLNLGGMVIFGYSEASESLTFTARGATADTGGGTAAIGTINFQAEKKSGSSAIALGTDENVLSIRNSSLTRFAVRGGGQTLHSDGSAAAPSISLLGDVDTGLYSANANELGFAAGGLLVAKLTSTALLSTIGGSTTLGRHVTFVGQVSNQTRTANTLGSMGGGVSLPAGTLAATGDSVHIILRGHVAASGSAAKAFNIKFGATTVCQLSLTGTQAQVFNLDVWVVRTGATTQIAHGVATTFQNGVVITNPSVRGDATSPAETLANAITIDFLGQSDGTQSLTLDIATVVAVTA